MVQWRKREKWYYILYQLVYSVIDRYCVIDRSAKGTQCNNCNTAKVFEGLFLV